EGERQAHGEGRALAFDAVDRQGSAQRLDVALDDVHADTAAGDVADGPGGREPRLHDEAMDLLVAWRVTGCDQAALEGALEDALAVQAAAIVGNLDRDAAGVVIGIQIQPARGGLAALASLRRGLDAVIDRVPHEVQQRIGDLFHHRLVELGLRSGEDDLHFLAELAAEVAGHAGEAAEGLADRHHAQLERPVAHFLDHLAHRRGGLYRVAVTGSPRGQGGPRARDDELPDQGDQLVELVGANADEAALDRLAPPDQVLLLERGVHQLALHRALADEDLSDPSRRAQRLKAQALVELALRQRAALHEQLAQPRLVLGQGVDQVDVVGDAAVRGQDADLAVLAQVLEHVLDRFLGDGAVEAQLHAEIARFRVHLGGGGHRVEYR